MEARKVRAIRFEQRGRVFYTAVMRADDIIEVSKVDIYDSDLPEERSGYQRMPSRARLRQVASFIEEEDSVLPTGGLLNARSPEEGTYGDVLSFKPDSNVTDGIDAGWLRIPPEAQPLYIVDMQHRLGGLEHAINEDGRDDLRLFPVVVTIADGLTRMEEVEQFEIINTTQKKVRTDLARRLISIQAKDAEARIKLEEKGKMWEARGPRVADWLNRQGVMWKDRIQPPNKTKKDLPNAIAKETSFVTSLKPVLQTPLFQHLPEEQIGELLDRYWHAVANMFPEAFDDPPSYVIQKTPGVFSLHKLFPEVIELVRTSGKDLSVENFAEAIAPWGELGSDYWETENEEGAARFGSMRGFATLAAELRELLPDLDITLT